MIMSNSNIIKLHHNKYTSCLTKFATSWMLANNYWLFLYGNNAVYNENFTLNLEKSTIPSYMISDSPYGFPVGELHICFALGASQKQFVVENSLKTN